jgi:hypothetical protein
MQPAVFRITPDGQTYVYNYLEGQSALYLVQDLSAPISWREPINLFNRVNVRALPGANTAGNANFGQITNPVGFMRITQVMFRFSF